MRYTRHDGIERDVMKEVIPEGQSAELLFLCPL